VEDLLGLARLPRMPLNLVGKLIEQQETLREENYGKGVDMLCFDDWIDGNSIGYDPLIYIEGVVIS
jgi:hypothetical protein